MKGQVTFVCQRLSPFGGLERVVVDLASELAEVVKVRVVVLVGDVPDELGDRLSNVDLIQGRDGVLAARRAVRSTSAGPIVVCGLWAAALLSPLGPVRNRSLVYWEHSLLENRLENDGRVRMLLRIARPLINSAETVVCVSAGVRRAIELAGFNRGSVTVVPNLLNLVECPRAESFSAADGIRLVGVGALRPIKNWSLALRTLVELPEDHELILVGDGPDMISLKAEADLLGVGGRTTFTGHVADVGHALASADALIHPSLAETFGLSVLEAAARDVPVVTLDVSALDEIVPVYAAGIRCRGNGPSELAEATSRVLEFRHSQQEEFVRARQQRLEAFSRSETLTVWQRLLMNSEEL